MSTPADRKYTESHEWLKQEDDHVVLGLTQHAVDELTDVTYVEMKPAGTEFEAGDVVGEVESVKATSEIYSAVGGEIVEVNESLESDPSVINSDPYNAGWLVKIKPSDTSPLDNLMDAEAYDKSH